MQHIYLYLVKRKYTSIQNKHNKYYFQHRIIIKHHYMLRRETSWYECQVLQCIFGTQEKIQLPDVRETSVSWYHRSPIKGPSPMKPLEHLVVVSLVHRRR